MKLIHTSLVCFLSLASPLTASLTPQHLLSPLDHHDPSLTPTLETNHGEDHHSPPHSPLLTLHRSLITLDSTTGSEKTATAFLTTHLRSLNYTVDTQDVGPAKDGRQNVYAYLGSSSAAKVLLTSHIDTVPPWYGYELTYRTPEDDRDGKTGDGEKEWYITGRGSVDAKACVAAQITALETLRASKKIAAGDVALLFVVGEETTGDGMRTFSASPLNPFSSSSSTTETSPSYHLQTIIFGEPTTSRLATGHKGLFAFTLTAHGKSAHSGYPELGRNANTLLIRALAHLENTTFPSSPKYGNTTLNVGYLRGGVAMNVIPERAEARVAVRLAAAPVAKAREMVRQTVSQIDPEHLKVHFVVDGYDPVDLDHDVPGFETLTVNYGTDVPHLKGGPPGQKRYLFGPGSILVAHGDHEGLAVRELEGAVAGYERLVLHALGRGS
ncbi:MAG: hypothetical protein M1817_004392 [Caeruleum heppii]|nr:MAG: hypothetical protein M1817_004392 [Caeruleum heppii]